MRSSNVLALLCVLFLSCCYGLHTDTNAYQENDQFEINTVGREGNRHLRSIKDADNNESAPTHGNAASNKHTMEDKEPSDTTERLNEERANPLSKITSSLSRSKSLPTTSTLSANKLAANSKIMRAFKKSSSFKQFSTYAEKSPAELRNDLAALQKTTGYKNLEKVMGKDPLTGNVKDFKRANRFVEKLKHRGGIALAHIAAALMLVVILGAAVGILFGPVIWFFVWGQKK